MLGEKSMQLVNLLQEESQSMGVSWFDESNSYVIAHIDSLSHDFRLIIGDVEQASERNIEAYPEVVKLGLRCPVA